jgi:hypothetical protein
MPIDYLKQAELGVKDIAARSKAIAKNGTSTAAPESGMRLIMQGGSCGEKGPWSNTNEQ